MKHISLKLGLDVVQSHIKHDMYLSACAPQLEPSSTILDVKKLFAKQSEFSTGRVYLWNCCIVDIVYMIVGLFFYRAKVLSRSAAVQTEQREK